MYRRLAQVGTLFYFPARNPTLTSVITDPPPPSISRHLTITTTSLSQRYPRAMIQLPPSPTLDPWASFDDSDEKPEVIGDDIPAAGPSRGKTPPHPLHSNDRLHVNHDRNGSLDVLGDVSRPALMRLTSETERQVAESSRSGSERGSLDLLRMSTSNAGAGAEEVEVLIHKVNQTRLFQDSATLTFQVKADESMPGIALLYGIDVSLLRP